MQTLGKADLNEVNFSFSKFILKINEPVDIHTLFKNLKPKMEKHHKPWITGGITIAMKKEKLVI